MQRERNSLDSFPEPIDLNQGSVPSNPSTMDHSSSWDNMLSPVENRLSNYMLGPADENLVCSDDADDDTYHNFSGWARGESSSGANNTRGGDDSKTNLGWPSSLFTSCSGHGPDLENWSFEPPSNTGTASNEPLSMQNYRAALSLNSNDGHTREQIPTFYASSSNNNIGAFTSSSSASGENNSTWGSSCKRKALEGTSGQFYPPGGSSPTNQNIMHHHHSHIPDFYASRGNLSISSSGTSGSSPTNYSEQVNPSQSGVSMSRQSPGFFPSSRGLAESPSRNLTSRPNHGRHEPVLFETPRGITSSSRNSGVYSSPSTTIPNAALNQPPHPMHVNEARGTYPYTWNGQSFNTRGSGSSEEAPVTNIRTSSSRRENNLEYPNVTRDQIDWSFAPGNSNRLSSRNHSSSSSGSRVGPSSSSSAWLRHHQNSNNQRLSEGSGPWVPLHGSGSESGIRRSHYLAHLPSSSSSSEEVGPSSRGQRRLDQRSAAGFLMDAQGEDINGWRSLAAVEGRHRLIRQVLTAMRRGVHLQGEEYMLVDPFMNGFAELHDRHRDMRLDVDNMSYEELLALEDRIGSVSTGLSEERIRSSLKQRKFKSFCVLPNMEPCCICQENYITGDDIGILDCGHEFHTGCVEQWLTQKNTCPICKMTALET